MKLIYNIVLKYHFNINPHYSSEEQRNWGVNAENLTDSYQILLLLFFVPGLQEESSVK